MKAYLTVLTQNLKNLYGYIQKDYKLNHQAHWEKKSSGIIEKVESKRKYKDFVEQKKKFIDIRRKKLAELLLYEDQMYKKEIIANQETPEEVRKKMEIKLKELKDTRENERLELVKKLQEKKFYEGADELRKNESEAFAIECYLEQENQMLDKLRKRENEKREESLYVKLNELDMKKRSK